MAAVKAAARRWTQEELARRIDYDVTYVRKIEWGERRPSEAIRVRLAQVLAVPVSSLPAAVAAKPPARLPDEASPLVGRVREMAEVTELFDGGVRRASEAERRQLADVVRGQELLLVPDNIE